MKTVVAGPVGTAHLTTQGGRMATLPVNHPQAGYVDPDLSLVDGRDDAEDLADEREEKIKARAAEVKAVEEAEEKVAKAEAGAAEEEPPKESKGKASA